MCPRVSFFKSSCVETVCVAVIPFPLVTTTATLPARLLIQIPREVRQLPNIVWPTRARFALDSRHPVVVEQEQRARLLSLITESAREMPATTLGHYIWALKCLV